MVVSDIIDKLSPNMAPPITVAIASAIGISVCSAMPIPIGANATTVPIDVPIEVEMKQPIINSPTNSIFSGRNDNPKFTVESTAPIPLATPEKAPAKIKTKHINKIVGCPAPLAKISTLLVKLSFLFIRRATALAITIATLSGIFEKSCVIMPVPIKSSTKMSNGKRANKLPCLLL